MVRNIAMMIAMIQVVPSFPQWEKINQISESHVIGSDDWVIELSNKIGNIDKQGYSVKVFQKNNEYIVIWYVKNKKYHAMHRKGMNWVSLSDLHEIRDLKMTICYKKKTFKLCGGGNFGLLHEKASLQERGDHPHSQ